MLVQIIQNNRTDNLNQNFTGKIVSTYALKKFKTKLNVVEADTFEKYAKDVESVNDGKNFMYKPVIVGNRVIAKIYELDKNGNPIDPPRFTDYGKNPMNVFKQLSDWYKSSADRI